VGSEMCIRDSDTSVRTYTQAFGNGPPSRVVEIRTSAFRPLRLSAPSRVRAQDVAHIFSRQVDRPVVAVALPPRSLSSMHAPPPLRSFGNETYLTLRAVLGRMLSETKWKFRAESLPGDGGRRQIDGGRLIDERRLGFGDARETATEVERFLFGLRRRGLIAVRSGAGRIDAEPLVVPVGSLGYLRQVGHWLSDAVLVNSHFFVLSATELDTAFGAVGDPFGMVAAGGRIQNPPTVRRATLVRSDGAWAVTQLGAEDLEITFSDGTSARAGQNAEFWYRGRSPEGEFTPVRTGALDVCIQGEWVSIVKTDGGLRVPHGALVVSFANEPSPSFRSALAANPRVRLSVSTIPDLTTALQVGPQLLDGGAVVVGEASFQEESFRTLGTCNPTGPVVFPADHDVTVAGRVGAGVTAEGSLVIVAIEGASSLASPRVGHPPGCTLLELAHVLAEAGAVDALNFDGGGSTQVFRGAGAILSSVDARDVPSSTFDRPVPVAGCATLRA